MDNQYAQLGSDHEELTQKYVIASINRTVANMRGQYDEGKSQADLAERLKKALASTGLDDEQMRSKILAESNRLESLCLEAHQGRLDLGPESYDRLKAVRELKSHYLK